MKYSRFIVMIFLWYALAAPATGQFRTGAFPNIHVGVSIIPSRINDGGQVSLFNTILIPPPEYVGYTNLGVNVSYYILPMIGLDGSFSTGSLIYNNTAMADNGMELMNLYRASTGATFRFALSSYDAIIIGGGINYASLSFTASLASRYKAATGLSLPSDPATGIGYYGKAGYVLYFDSFYISACLLYTHHETAFKSTSIAFDGNSWELPLSIGFVF